MVIDMKNKIGSILIVIVIIIAVIGTTYSWFSWKSKEENKIGVNFSTSGASSDCITYSTNTSGNPILIPTSTKEKGYITTIEIAQTCNVNLYVDLNLTLTKFPTALRDASFKYTLVEGSTIIGEGNFADKSQGTTFKIATRQLLTTSPKTYTLYLWIDGNLDNNSAMQNQEYEFNLDASVTDEIIN